MSWDHGRMGGPLQDASTLAQGRAFLGGSEEVEIEIRQRAAAYAFVADPLRQFGYTRLGKADKS